MYDVAPAPRFLRFAIFNSHAKRLTELWDLDQRFGRFRLGKMEARKDHPVWKLLYGMSRD